MDHRNVRDSAFESVDVEDSINETSNENGDTSLDLLEQQQAKEQARLLQRFRELRQWQQQQQEQLMQQQHLQLEMLKGEQMRVQTLIAAQRGAQWGDGRVSRYDSVKKSPPLMTPPRRTGLGGELARTLMGAFPHASADSGLVASMGDTLEQPKATLPRPVMYHRSPSVDEDKYTNPELFSNPGSHADDLQSLDDQQFGDNGSDISSDNFYLPPLPPDPTEAQGDMGSSLKTLQALIGTKNVSNFLQQMLGLVPAQQKSLLLEQRQAVVQESASPTFSPVNPSASHQSVLPATPGPASSSAHSSVQALLPPAQSCAQPKEQTALSSQPHFRRSNGYGAQTDQFLLSTSQVQRPVPSSQSSVQPISQSHRHVMSLNSQSQCSEEHLQQQHYPQQPSSHSDCTVFSQHAQRQFQTHPSSDHKSQTQTHPPSDHKRQFQTHPPSDHKRQFQTHPPSNPKRQSQTHPPSYHNQVPVEPEVRVRVSWEQDQHEDERRDISGQNSIEEEGEEEEDMEVTVKVLDSHENRPIRPGLQGRKTFEQLLEERLADEEKKIEKEKKLQEINHSSTHHKQAFLRKGQGIARFSQSIRRTSPKRPSGGGVGHKNESSRITTAHRSNSAANTEQERTAVQIKPPVKRQLEKKRPGAGRKKQLEEDPPQSEKLKLIKKKSESNKKWQVQSRPEVQAAQSKELAGKRLQSEELEEKDPIADDASFVASVKERAKKAPLEEEELDEFETLEDIADNMSLVSNSSVVHRLITPNKQRQKNAVSDLKSVLDKKKNMTSSPFERNAAIRSLLSVNNFRPAVSQSHEVKDRMENHCEDKDDTDVDADLEAESSESVVNTDCKQTEANTLALDKRNCASNDIITPFTSLSETAFKQRQPSGVEFSKQFSSFGQHDTDITSGVPPSPIKSVTRKVATIQSRLNVANDTAAILQKLSAHAGYLFSGNSEESCEKTQHDKDQYRNDNSLLSSSVSIPRHLVIGGASEANSNKTLAEDRHGDDENMSWEEDSNDDTVRAGDDNNSSSEEEEPEESDRQSQKSSVAVASASDIHSQENSNNNCYENQKYTKYEFDDGEEWTDTQYPVSDQPVSSQPDFGVKAESTPPTSKLMSRLFPKLKPKPSAVQQQHQQKMLIATTTNLGDGIQSKVLREKLEELEIEIEKFRSENAALEKLRREREEGVNKLKGEIACFAQEKSDELRRLEEFKAQETKKIKHERKLFETYQKQVRSMPDKKDREEIELLKRQLTDLQEEMKRKESRWSSNNTRLKTRITELEGENAALREEVNLLERKRLEWIQSAQSQPKATVRSVPRSSTPAIENTVAINGILDTPASAVNGSHPKPPATASLSSGAVAMMTCVNGVGAAVKISSGGGGSSGESMPRGQPATPSMIEGVSPAAIALGGDGSENVRLSGSAALRHAVDRPTIDKGNGKYEETQYSDGKIERVYNNGTREVLFANGTRKEISPDGQYFIVSFFNGDIKQVFPDQHVVYYYAESQTTHTTYPDRLEVLQFPNNQTEKHYPDGTHEITFANQTVKYLFPNGSEESVFPDGTILRINKNGERIMEFPNGQREIHTQQHKRREYPDGTVKTLHNDGRQETRYSTGRIRLKDKHGNVIVDRMF